MGINFLFHKSSYLFPFVTFSVTGINFQRFEVCFLFPFLIFPVVGINFTNLKPASLFPFPVFPFTGISFVRSEVFHLFPFPTFLTVGISNRLPGTSYTLFKTPAGTAAPRNTRCASHRRYYFRPHSRRSDKLLRYTLHAAHQAALYFSARRAQ